MAKRDPAKTAVNKTITQLTASLKANELHVMSVLKEPNVLALHGLIGGKNAEFIDVKNDVILTPESYYSAWIRGLLGVLDGRRPLHRGDPYYEIFLAIKTDPIVADYITTFQKRTYLRNLDALSRVRPLVEEAEIWIGQQKASYGILITPRFVNGVWENDKSEIRHFPHAYWTIGHILETGLVVPNDPDKITFADVQAYLAFFKNILVRNSGSKHEGALANLYVDFVRAQPDPVTVPLLIPEFRYDGVVAAHKYRLDFTVIDPFSMEKVGFELSPWSTHGALTGTKGKTQSQINDEAQANFEAEMKKHKDYYRKHGVYALIFTDSDLTDPRKLFDENIKECLTPKRIPHQLEIQAMDELFRFKV